MNRLRFLKKPPKIRRVTYSARGRQTLYVPVNNSYSVPDDPNRSFTPLVVPRDEPIPPPETGTTSASYGDKRKKSWQSWESLREDLIHTRTEEFSPATFKCVKCGFIENEIIKCIDCSAVAYYCHKCCEDVHTSVLFHSPCVWKGTVFVPLAMQSTLKRLDHECSTTYEKEMCIVDSKGLQHRQNFTFCRCEKEPVTLLRYRFWSASPEFPQVAICLQLMELATVLQLEGQMSLKTFCDALSNLRQYSIRNVEEVKDVYRLLVGDSFNEYRYHRTRLSHAHHLCQLKSGECPACSLESTPKQIISVDANFGLVHKKSSGQGYGKPRHHEDTFFIDQDDVDNFVNNYQGSKHNDACSTFQAGSAIRSKIKTNKLDFTGLFGSVCKHDFPQQFCNLTCGERLAYSVYFLEKIKKESAEKKVIFMYDIACMLFKHLVKNKRTELIDGNTFAVPVFHSFAHNMQCQILYGQKNVTETGLADGEGVERLWSYLRRFSKITKEMTISNRHDLLVDALYHYSEKVQMKLCERVKSRYQKAGQLEDVSVNCLAQNDPLNQAKQLFEERHNAASKLPVKDGTEKITSEEEYSWLLFQAHKNKKEREQTNLSESQRKKLNDDSERLEKKMSKFPKKEDVDSPKYKHLLESFKTKKQLSLKREMKLQAVERAHLLSTMKRYADGQDVATRIGKQLSSVNAKMNASLRQYNLFMSKGIDTKFSDISSPEAVFYSDVDTLYLSQSQTEILETYASSLRSKQEVIDSKTEMNNIIQWIEGNEQATANKIAELQNCEGTRYIKGSISLLIHLKIQFERLHMQAYEYFKDIVKMDINTPVLDHIKDMMHLAVFEPTVSSEELAPTLELLDYIEEEDEDLDLSDED